MSANTATEWHANAKSDEEDLTTTKALTRGTQDVNDGNVGRTEDPHMSSEASVKGTSAKSTEMTPVILESMPHELQNQLQNSLPLTLRLPIEGEPSRCKQEVADSIVMAGCTNGMVEMSEPLIAVSRTKHVWYSEHGTYYRFEFILERMMSATHVAVIPCTRTHSDEEEFLKK